MVHKAKQQSGMVLILSILIVAAVLATVAIFSNLIIREIFQSRLVDQSIQSYYLAESGTERTLYQTRKREAIPDCAIVGSGACNDNGFCPVDTDHDGLQNDIPCITTNQGALGAQMKGDWNVVVSHERSMPIFLQPGGSFQFDLFSPYLGADFISNLNAIKIQSDPTSNPNNNLSDFKLYGQLTNLSWLVNGSPTCPVVANQRAILQDFIVGSSHQAVVTGLVGNGINQNCSYTFRIIDPLPAGGGLSGKYTVSLHSLQNGGVPTDQNQIDIPSRLILDSSATVGNSYQTVRAKTPIRPPLSGLYDFVLFSEEKVVK